MALDFPDSPVLDEQFVSGTTTFQWDGTVWRRVAPVKLAGTTPADIGVVYVPDAGLAVNPDGALILTSATATRLGGHHEPNDPTGVKKFLRAGNNQWIESADAAAVFIGDDPPVATKIGDLWWESDTGVLHIYYDDGTSAQWVEISNADGTVTGATIHVGDNPPATPLKDQFWFDGSTGKLFIYFDDGDSSQWVQVSGGGGGTYNISAGVPLIQSMQAQIDRLETRLAAVEGRH